MTVQLLLVLFLQAEEDLDGAGSGGDLAGRGNDDLGGELEDVCGDVLATDSVLGDAFLITTHLILR